MSFANSVEASGVGFGIEEEGTRIVPFVEEGCLYVSQFSFRNSPQCSKVFRACGHRLRSQRLYASVSACRNMFPHVVEFEPPFVRCPRPYGTSAVDIQLFEAPFVYSCLWHPASPPALFGVFPASEPYAATDDGFLPAVSFKYHRPVIVGSEHDGSFQSIGPLCKMDICRVTCRQTACFGNAFVDILGLGDCEPVPSGFAPCM